MTRVILDWDSDELRYAAGQLQSDRLKSLAALGRVSLKDQSLLEALKQVVTENRLSDGQAIVLLDRKPIELRPMNVPSVPAEEMPGLVNFQASRTMTGVGGSAGAVIDYLDSSAPQRGTDEESGKPIMVAAIPSTTIQKTKKAIEAAGLKLAGMRLRTLASSYLPDDSSSGNRLMIGAVGESCELLLLCDGRPAVVRTIPVKLGEQASVKTLCSSIAGEVKRSLLTQRLSATDVAVDLWGGLVAYEDALRESLIGDGVQSVDLISVSRLVEGRLANGVTADDEELAVLVSALSTPLADSHAIGAIALPSQIDFLHPRAPAPPPDRRKSYALIGAAVAAAILLLIGWLWNQLSSLDDQIASMKDANNSQADAVSLANESVSQLGNFDTYLDGGVAWLSEIDRVAQLAPPSDQLQLRSLGGKADPRTGGGVLRIVAMATSPEVIDEFEQALRDDQHEVTTGGAKEVPDRGKYRWEFNADIKVGADTVHLNRYEQLKKLNEPAAALENAAEAEVEEEPSSNTEVAS
ncbi:MAG: hypothetical protein AAF664_13045 [Planctomycetota bacterium]